MNQTLEASVVLPVDLEATHPYVLEFVSLEELPAQALSLPFSLTNTSGSDL